MQLLPHSWDVCVRLLWQDLPQTHEQGYGCLLDFYYFLTHQIFDDLGWDWQPHRAKTIYQSLVSQLRAIFMFQEFDGTLLLGPVFTVFLFKANFDSPAPAWIVRWHPSGRSHAACSASFSSLGFDVRGSALCPLSSPACVLSPLGLSVLDLSGAARFSHLSTSWCVDLCGLHLSWLAPGNAAAFGAWLRPCMRICSCN